ncbi:hypothetical protein N7468_004796 [Penicillium chermesinum]|uniref:Alanyl-transfer RNA synthetases family profile domain-containing protein n=1 Tax=Penicillium chermesinum TaxID=63820 RepID=A0A9W9PC40_9EURO|nr:uncharacterized protein N7468_004796 [Penicillium chermesinum]KAJ5240177.1 hypothetical protein N7468_004796 [Penicillium chermesinum]KAJ6167049.1 hypothetical protein N7470_002496 [Penicillium chermesinum]
MPTEAVYLHDASLRTLTTEVVSYQPIASLSEDDQSLAKNVDPEYAAMTTRQTILYAQGGGQPSDTGTIGAVDQEPGFTVSLVRKAPDGRILHFGKSVASNTAFTEGQAVVQKVDSAKRDYHSRLHTGGHILGVAMEVLMPEMKEVKANHFPKEASLEYEGLLYNDSKPLLQAKVDELVQKDLPVLISWLEPGTQVDERAKVGDGPVRIVSIGGLDHNPCGGTHVETSGQVGSVTIRKISRQKGITRISYDVPAAL